VKDVTEVKDLFNAKAGTWNQKYQPGGALSFRVAAFEEILLRRLSPGDTVLDLGCGTGAIASALAARGFRVTACDVAEEMIGAGKRIFNESVIEWLLLPSDWKRLPFDANAFDAIVASSIFEYLPDVDAVLAECQRILKPGGFLVATVPNPRKLIRKLENLIRPAAILASQITVLKRVPKLHSYTSYLKYSRNRMPLDDWFAIGARAQLSAVEQDRSRTGNTALAFLVYRKPATNSDNV